MRVREYSAQMSSALLSKSDWGPIATPGPLDTETDKILKNLAENHRQFVYETVKRSVTLVVRVDVLYDM